MSAGRAVGLLLGVAADAALGDPQRGHPVAAFGKAAQVAEKLLHQDKRSAGVAYTGLLVGGTLVLGALAERRSRRSPVMQAALTAVTRTSAFHRHRMVLCFASSNSRRKAPTSAMPTRSGKQCSKLPAPSSRATKG